MAITLVNKLGTANGTSTTSVALTLANAVAVGDTVVVAVGWGANTGTSRSVTDTGGNTYSEITIANNGGSTFAALYWAHVTTGLNVGDSITFHTTQSVNSVTVGAYDYSGLQVAPLDQSIEAAAGTSTPNPSSGNVTTTAANELLFCVLAHGSLTPTAGTGFTALDHNGTESSHFFDTEHQIVSSAGSYAGTWTLSAQTWSTVFATFKGATGSVPVNTVAPAVTGTSHVGQTLSTTNGTWTDDGSPTFTYQWQRDNNGGGVYSNITGATSSTYMLVSTDDTCNVRCVVTDTDSNGATSANSNSLSVTYAPPTNTVVPNVTGTPFIGSVLTTDNGTWNPS